MASPSIALEIESKLDKEASNQQNIKNIISAIVHEQKREVYKTVMSLSLEEKLYIFKQLFTNNIILSDELKIKLLNSIIFSLKKEESAVSEICSYLENKEKYLENFLILHLPLCYMSWHLWCWRGMTG